MLFNYNKFQVKKQLLIFSYIIFFCATMSTADASNKAPVLKPLTTQQVALIIKRSNFEKSFHISATPEVVGEINALRRSEQAGSYMRECLHRMNQYLPVIQKALNITAMPIELLAIPLIESGYQPLVENKNPTLASGIWQLMPKTARHFGLIVKAKHDDRLNTLLETNAAVTYLNAMHDQFNDWKLVVIAYKIGEDKTEELIKAVGSRDASVLIHSSKAPRHLKKYISMFDSTVIIIRNPSLIAE